MSPIKAMFVDGSSFKGIHQTSIKPLQNINAIQRVVLEEKIFEGFLPWFPWQPGTQLWNTII